MDIRMFENKLVVDNYFKVEAQTLFGKTVFVFSDDTTVRYYDSLAEALNYLNANLNSDKCRELANFLSKK